MFSLIPASQSAIKLHRQLGAQVLARPLPLTTVQAALDECNETEPRTPTDLSHLLNYLVLRPKLQGVLDRFRNFATQQIAHAQGNTIEWHRLTLQPEDTALPTTVTQQLGMIGLDTGNAAHLHSTAHDGTEGGLLCTPQIFSVLEQCEFGASLALALGDSTTAEHLLARQKDFLWQYRDVTSPRDQRFHAMHSCRQLERSGDMVLDQIFSSTERQLWGLGEVATCYRLAAEQRQGLIDVGEGPSSYERYSIAMFLDHTHNLARKHDLVRTAFRVFQGDRSRAFPTEERSHTFPTTDTLL